MKLIFSCISGSYLYGLNRPDSDLDIRGVCLNTKKSLLGLTAFEQWLPDKESATLWSGDMFGLESDDVQIYGLNKFCSLCLQNNPNIVEMLFAPNLLKNNHIWNIVVENRHLFLSTKIVHTFSGYAYSQLQRIKGHKRWIGNPPIKPSPEDYGMIHTSKGGQKWTDSNKYNQYQSLIKDYNSYITWNLERNPTRKLLEEKYGYDSKHAMHLCRLIFEATDLLRYGTLEFPLPQYQINYLKGVLNGELSYEQILHIGESSHDELSKLESISVLPHAPDFNGIETMLIKINEEYAL